MSEDLTADFVRRERVTDALLEFDRRIRERVLPVNDSECWDVAAQPASGSLWRVSS